MIRDAIRARRRSVRRSSVLVQLDDVPSKAQCSVPRACPANPLGDERPYAIGESHCFVPTTE
jgi:hypothetical protein